MSSWLSESDLYSPHESNSIKSCTFSILTLLEVSRVSSFVLSDRAVTTEIAQELEHSKHVGKFSQLRWRIWYISETPLHNTVRPNKICLTTVIASCHPSFSYYKSSSSHGSWNYTVLSSTNFVDPWTPLPDQYKCYWGQPFTKWCLPPSVSFRAKCKFIS